MRSVSESLAGRVGLLELGPFSAAELAAAGSTFDHWFWGGFPPVQELRGARARASWLDGYVSTFLERDVPAARHPRGAAAASSALDDAHARSRQCAERFGSVALVVEGHTIGENISVVPWADVVARKADFGLGTRSRAKRPG